MRTQAIAIVTWAMALTGTCHAQSVNPQGDLRAGMNEIVSVDSRGWMFNRYDYGSMRNVRVESRSQGGSSAVVIGNYTYNGGRPGWVRAQIQNGNVVCVEYWDFAGRCRPIGRSYSWDLLNSMATASASGGAAPARSGGYNAQDHQRACQSGACGPSN